MALLLLAGFACVLLVLGAILTKDPWKFALKGLVVTGAIVFVGFVIVIIWVLLILK